MLIFLSIVILLLNIFHPYKPVLNPSKQLLFGAAYRQAQTATVAKNYYHDGINLFTAELDVLGVGPEKNLLLEMPIYQAIVAFLYKIFGEYPSIGNLLSLLSHFISTIILFLILKYLHKENYFAFTTSIIYLFFPLNIYYSSHFIGDGICIMFLLFGMYICLRFIDKPHITTFVLSILFFLLSFLIKPPYGPFIFLPLLYYALSQKKDKWKKTTYFLVVCFVTVAITFIWQSYTQNYNVAHGYSFFSLSNPEYRDRIFGIGEHQIQVRLSLYEWIYRLGHIFITPDFSSWKPMVTLLPVWYIIGVYSYLKYGFAQKTFSRFLHFWIVGYIIYYFIFFNAMNHYYYGLIMIPLAAIILAHPLFHFYKICREKYMKITYGITGGILSIYIILTSITFLNDTIGDDYKLLYDTAKEIESHTELNSSIIHVSWVGWNSTVAFHSNRVILPQPYNPKEEWLVFDHQKILERDFDKYDYLVINKKTVKDLISMVGPVFEDYFQTHDPLEIEDGKTLIFESDIIKLYKL